MHLNNVMKFDLRSVSITSCYDKELFALLTKCHGVLLHYITYTIGRLYHLSSLHFVGLYLVSLYETAVYTGQP